VPGCQPAEASSAGACRPINDSDGDGSGIRSPEWRRGYRILARSKRRQHLQELSKLDIDGLKPLQHLQRAHPRGEDASVVVLLGETAQALRDDGLRGRDHRSASEALPYSPQHHHRHPPEHTGHNRRYRDACKDELGAGPHLLPRRMIVLGRRAVFGSWLLVILLVTHWRFACLPASS
jgi:hypothetical protein